MTVVVNHPEEKGDGMATNRAASDSGPRALRVRRKLTGLLASGESRSDRYAHPVAREVRSRYIAELLGHLNELEHKIQDDWEQLDPETREDFHDIAHGGTVHRSIPDVIRDVIHRVPMFWSRLRYPADVEYYHSRSLSVARLIQEKVGFDIWTTALSSPERVAAAKRGLADARAGNTIDLAEV